MKSRLFLVFLSFTFTFTIHINHLPAQTPTCHPNSPASKTTQGNQFKINYEHVNDLAGGITSLQWKYNILNASEQWNNFANGGWFEFNGDTNLKWIPPNACTTEQKINLVTINTANLTEPLNPCNGTATAVHQRRCDGNNWMITICATNTNGILNYSIGSTPSSSKLDVNAVLVHEFGHALGLNHADITTGQKAAVISSTSWGSLKQRSLYPWDIECHERIYGRRKQKIHYRRQNHNSILFTSTLYTMATNYARGIGNARDYMSTPYYSSVAYEHRFRNSTSDQLTTTPTNFNEQYRSNFTNSWFRESPDRWRTMYLYDNESTNRYQNLTSLNNIYQYAYDHTFSSSTLIQGHMSHCTNSAPFTCSPKNIYSYHPISTTFDSHTSKTIFSWVNQTRQDGADDREIWISVGFNDSTGRRLNAPYKTGIRSSTNVSVACGPSYSAAEYDCILVYSPIEDAEYPLKVRQFYIEPLPGGESKIFWRPSTSSVGWLTGSNATAWYNNHNWFIAHTSGTGIQVRKSTDSINWTHSETLQQPVGAPRVININQTHNREALIYFTGR